MLIVFVPRSAFAGAKCPGRVPGSGMISVRTSSTRRCSSLDCHRRFGANLAVQRARAQTDDWFHVLLHYDRLRVVLHGSLLVAGGTPRLAMHGTRGSWLKYGSDVQEQQLISGITPGQPGWGEDPRGGLLYKGSSQPPSELPVPKGDHRQYYFRIRDAIRKQAD